MACDAVVFLNLRSTFVECPKLRERLLFIVMKFKEESERALKVQEYDVVMEILLVLLSYSTHNMESVLLEQDQRKFIILEHLVLLTKDTYIDTRQQDDLITFWRDFIHKISGIKNDAIK